MWSGNSDEQFFEWDQPSVLSFEERLEGLDAQRGQSSDATTVIDNCISKLWRLAISAWVLLGLTYIYPPTILCGAVLLTFVLILLEVSPVFIGADHSANRRTAISVSDVKNVLRLIDANRCLVIEIGKILREQDGYTVVDRPRAVRIEQMVDRLAGRGFFDKMLRRFNAELSDKPP